MYHFWYFGKKPPPPAFEASSIVTAPTLEFRHNCCCCSRCAEIDRGANGVCPECCRCVPSEFCLTFYPEDSSQSATRSRLSTLSAGLYEEDSVVFNITIQFDADACQWLVESSAMGVDAAFDVRGEDGIGCRDPVFSDLPAVHDGDAGTLELSPFYRVGLPLYQDDNGCWQPMCDCDCLCGWLCVQYAPATNDQLLPVYINYLWDFREGAWVDAEYGVYPPIYLTRNESGECLPYIEEWNEKTFLFIEDEEFFPLSCELDLHMDFVEDDAAGDRDAFIADCAFCHCERCQACDHVPIPEVLTATSTDCIDEGGPQEVTLNHAATVLPYAPDPSAWQGSSSDYVILLYCRISDEGEHLLYATIQCDGEELGTFPVTVTSCDPFTATFTATNHEAIESPCLCDTDATWELTDGR